MRAERHTDEKPAPVLSPTTTRVPDWSEIKAWARRELALQAGGASQDEREKLNP